MCTVGEAGTKFVVKDCGFEDLVVGGKGVAGSVDFEDYCWLLILFRCDEQPPSAAAT